MCRSLWASAELGPRLVTNVDEESGVIPWRLAGFSFSLGRTYSVCPMAGNSCSEPFVFERFGSDSIAIYSGDRMKKISNY